MRKRTITETDVRQAWAELLAPERPLVTGRGMTVAEMAATGGECETTLRRRVRALVATGKLRQIGVRPGRSRSAVYEIV